MILVLLLLPVTALTLFSFKKKDKNLEQSWTKWLIMIVIFDVWKLLNLAIDCSLINKFDGKHYGSFYFCL